MKRFVVIAKQVKYKGKMYNVGDFLPPNFSEKERFRLLYPSRVGTVEVPEEPKTATVSKKAESKAETSKPSVKPPTGTKTVSK